MESVYQDPRDLMLGITRGPIITNLQVLDRTLVALNHYDIQFHIIGESHWVVVRKEGELLFQEVLACVELQDVRWDYKARLTDLKHAYSCGTYHTRVWSLPLDCDIMRLGTSANSIQVDFPNPKGSNMLPFTRIWWGETDRRVWWRSIHVYSLMATTIAVISCSSIAIERAA